MPLFPTESPYPPPFVSVAAIITQLEERSKVVYDDKSPITPLESKMIYSSNSPTSPLESKVVYNSKSPTTRLESKAVYDLKTSNNSLESKADVVSPSSPSNSMRKPAIPKPTCTGSPLSGMERYAQSKPSEGKNPMLEKELPLLPPEREALARLSRVQSRQPSHAQTESREVLSPQQYRRPSFVQGEVRSMSLISPVPSADRIHRRMLDRPAFRGVIPEPSPSLTPTSSRNALSPASHFPSTPYDFQSWNFPLTPPTPLSPFTGHMLEGDLAYSIVSDKALSSSPAPPTEYSRTQSMVTVQGMKRLTLGNMRGDDGMFSTHLTIDTRSSTRHDSALNLATDPEEVEVAGVMPTKEDSNRSASSAYTELKPIAMAADDDEWEDEDETVPPSKILTPQLHQELVNEYRRLATPSADVWKEPGSSEEDVSGKLRMVPRPLFWEQPRAVQHTRLMGQPKTSSPRKSSMAKHFPGHDSQLAVARSKQARAVPSKRTSAVFVGRPQSKLSTSTRHTSIKVPKPHGYTHSNITVTTTYPYSPDSQSEPTSPMSDTSTSSLWSLFMATATRPSGNTSFVGPDSPYGPMSPRSNARASSPTNPYATIQHEKPNKRRITPPKLNTAIITNAFNSVVSSIHEHSRTSSTESKWSKHQSKANRSSGEKKEGFSSSPDTPKTQQNRRSKFPKLFGLGASKAENREREKRKTELKKKIQYVNTVDPNDHMNYEVRSPGGWI